MEFSPEDNPRDVLLRELRGQLGRHAALPTDDVPTFSSGSAALDRVLPGGGFRHGMLVEWLAELPGGGAATLSLVAAREACRTGGVLVVIDRRQTFYPPAAVAWGIEPKRMVVVHPRTARDELWAAVQSLRSPAVAAMWAEIDQLDSRAFRRLQLAAEAGRTLGLVVRPAKVRGQPSWADVRLGVGTRGWGLGTKTLAAPSPQSPAPTRRVHISVLRCRAGRSGGNVLLAIDDVAHEIREVNAPHAPHSLPVVAELADPAADSIPARA